MSARRNLASPLFFLLFSQLLVLLLEVLDLPTQTSAFHVPTTSTRLERPRLPQRQQRALSFLNINTRTTVLERAPVWLAAAGGGEGSNEEEVDAPGRENADMVSRRRRAGKDSQDHEARASR